MIENTALERIWKGNILGVSLLPIITFLNIIDMYLDQEIHNSLIQF